MLTRDKVEEVYCADCHSSDLGILYGHDCPNDSRYRLRARVDVSPEPSNGNGKHSGNGNGNNRSTTRMATEKQIKFMIDLGLNPDVARHATFEHAKEHIARLLENQKMAGESAPVKLASEKQISYLRSLIADRPGSFDGDVAKLSSKEASDLIQKLKAMPKGSQADKPKSALDMDDGFYVDIDNQVYKAQYARSGSGNLYAKQLVVVDGHGTFEYVSGLVYKLKQKLANGEAEKLSLERAKSLGHLYGVCCACGATLTDENSIAAGIGPICAQGF